MSEFAIIAEWIRHYIVVAMTAVFVGIFITTYWPSRKKSLDRLAQIPLDDDRQGG
jgi:cbb3-type cytochrome oxidase subunit 3